MSEALPVEGWLERLQECLCDALGETDMGVPGQCCVLPGQDIPLPTLGCCDQAWVRLVRAFATRVFPQQLSGSEQCTTWTWAAEIELGVGRCVCIGHDDGSDCTCEEYEQDVITQAQDMRALLKTVRCCATGINKLAFPGVYRPFGPGGGCGGGLITVTVPLETCC